MTCTQCKEKEVTSKITGELCTSCYFNNKKNKTSPEPIKELVSPTLEQRISIPVESQITEVIAIGRSESESTELIDIREAIIASETQEHKEYHAILDKEEEYNIKKEHQPSKSKETKDPTKKYCQSCIERGYGLKLATREWTPNFFICDDCFQPLLNNVLGHSVDRVELERVKSDIKVDSPVLEQFYTLLNIPAHLQFNQTDDVLNNRNDLFTHHATALVNLELPEITERLELFQVMLFQIKVGIEPLQDYINRVKAKKREEANIEGIKKSKSEKSKTGSTTSKAKLSQEEKLAKSLNISVEKLREMSKAATNKEFDNILKK